MKINEVIVNEGFWDALAAGTSGVKSALANPTQMGGGFKQGYNKSVGNSRLQGMANAVTTRWQQSGLPSVPLGAQQNPQQLKPYLDKFLSNYFAGDYSSNLQLANVSPATVTAYIRSAVNAENLGQQAPKPEVDKTPGSEGKTLPPGSSKVLPAPEPNAGDNLSLATNTTQPAQPNLDPRIQVINSNPVTFRFKGKDYVLGDDDTWTDLASGRVANPNMSAYLIKQMQAL